ncbi:transposase [Rhodopirellula bahusiensis]|uniref:transposase n=1 Tax=Rhodopirellula bahusiensis TaxID=2014065 RepID=UPI00329A654C
MGRSRGGFSSKPHLLCVSLGHPLTAVLSPGQAYESKSLKVVWDQANICGRNAGEPIVPAKLAGDKGYRYDWIDHWLLEKETQPVVASKWNEDRTQRPVGFDNMAYRRHGVVEQMIGWLNESRHGMRRWHETTCRW